MCMQFSHTVCALSWTYCSTICLAMPMCTSTTAKPAFGMRRARPHLISVTLVQKFGSATIHPRPNVQGLRDLGVPIGHPAYIQTQLQQISAQHSEFFEKIPAFEDVQASWLLLLFCASPRANYLLRSLPPPTTATFANDHDVAVASALTELLQTSPLPAAALARAHLPLHQGGLGLTSATCPAHVAYWASWGGALPTLEQQVPDLTHRLTQHLQHPTAAPPSLQAASRAADQLHQHGWEPPRFRHSSRACARRTTATHYATRLATRSHSCCTQSMATELLSTLDPASAAMMASHSGPFASRVFTTAPHSPDLCCLFRLLLLRRLRLPLPLTERTCRCRRVLEPLGGHRSACLRSGVLGSRACPLERAAARVCREAGARVTTNALLSDLNIPSVDRMDRRRIEVIANGLPLFQGAQLAIDTTSSALTTNGEPRRYRGTHIGAAFHQARRAKERTYPELTRGGRCRLVVLAFELGGRFSTETAAFLRALARARARSAPAPLRAATIAGLVGRWSALLTHAAQNAFAASLMADAIACSTNVDGDTPCLSDILAQAPLTPPPSPASPKAWTWGRPRA